MNLSQLRAKVDDIIKARAANKKAIAELTQRNDQLLKEQRELECAIAELKIENKAVLATDHAILRFMERCLGYNIEKIRSMLLTKETVNCIKQGDGEYDLDGRHTMVVRQHQVVTIKAKR